MLEPFQKQEVDVEKMRGLESARRLDRGGVGAPMYVLNRRPPDVIDLQGSRSRRQCAVSDQSSDFLSELSCISENMR